MDVQPLPQNGAGAGPEAATARHQRWCTADVPAGADRCPRCGVWQLKNTGAMKPGSSRQEPPPDLRQNADELIAGILVDLGGVDELSTLEKETVRMLADVQISARLLMNEMATNGLFTPGRNVRQVYDKWLQAVDRFDRLSQRLGLGRRARSVGQMSASEYLETTRTEG